MTPHVISLPADNTTDRKGQSIVAIIAHGTGGTDSRSTLKTGDGRGVSIHVLITKTGDIYRMVADERGANHAGAATSSFTLHGKTYTNGAVNRATLGFELENLQDGRDPYPDAQLLAMGWQLTQWRDRWGNLPILRHGDLDPTRRRDPVKLTANDMELWAAKAAAPIMPLPVVQRYRVAGTPIFQRQDLTGPIVAFLAPGEVVQIDMLYESGAAHLADERGFIALSNVTGPL